MIIFAIVTISMALVFYTIGVFGEKLSGGLKSWNLILFWIGLFFDTTGTLLMSLISKQDGITLHFVTGALALILMLFHAAWATIVLIKKNEQMIMKFHRFSIVVWLIWLVPYLTGVIINI
ncbi:TIGR03987 family protein [Thiospirochaeta perfilievii]|uniref:TIGR03987 family protein n=1 Tax=Thiospirochaeta perfilievii TaxID=252967 RepID=A0A5C1Q9H3_9SPIO|nr:HsmA family protein [Thiospirochaeta perfilievii]QEN03549.1 TIGR03987 family protein [Thiospirochaeta perfilievii]